MIGVRLDVPGCRLRDGWISWLCWLVHVIVLMFVGMLLLGVAANRRLLGVGIALSLERRSHRWWYLANRQLPSSQVTQEGTGGLQLGSDGSMAVTFLQQNISSGQPPCSWKPRAVRVACLPESAPVIH